MILSFSQRLQYIIKSKGLTANALSVALGVQRSNISHILNDRNKPSFDFIEKLHEHFPDINPAWLISGKGRPFMQPAAPAAERPAKEYPIPEAPAAEKQSNNPLKEPTQMILVYSNTFRILQNENV